MDKINYFLWIIVSLILLSSGIFYTFKLKGVQFRLGKMINSLKINRRKKTGISPLASLSLSLASRIGVGSLSGIALAIYNGGVGTIFWMLLFTILLIPNAFVESSLSVIFHRKKGEFYEGGPTYYMEDGLKSKKLAWVYGLLSLICYMLLFNAIQANTIASYFNSYLNIPLIATGIVLGIITLIVIIGNIKKITNFTMKLVPFMGIVYMLMSIVIIIFNIKLIPGILSNIVLEALSFNSLKWGIISSMIIAIQRAIFSSEIGMGSGAIASGSSNTDKPEQEGYIQMLGIYFTIFVVCLSTAIILLTSNAYSYDYVDPNGIEIVKSAINYHFNDIGNILLMIVVFAFSFSTIISNYCYSENNIKYVANNYSKKLTIIVKIIFCTIIIISSIISPTYLWNTVDIGNGLLIIINCYAIFRLSKYLKGENNESK